MNFSARVILDSIGPNDARLTTFEVVMPRIVLAEFNTHRMFSRNSASSRAIPVEKMLQRVAEHPFVPERFPLNEKGMQANTFAEGDLHEKANDTWASACVAALHYASELKKLGIHKAISNRLIEPFMWHVVVFTATELSNFYALRDNPMAQAEMQKPAHLILEAYERSKPMRLDAGEWHLPFVTGVDLMKSDGDNVLDFESRPVGGYLPPGHWAIKRERGGADTWCEGEPQFENWAKISAARCARTSYLTHEGRRDINEDATLYEKLTTSGHMSPLEHPAQALTMRQWHEVIVDMAEDWGDRRVPVGNFWGWMQLRKTILGEHDFARLKAGDMRSGDMTFKWDRRD